MQPEELCHVVEELAGTPVEALHYCLGDGRTMLHDSATTELWGDNVEARRTSSFTAPTATARSSSSAATTRCAWCASAARSSASRWCRRC